MRSPSCLRTASIATGSDAEILAPAASSCSIKTSAGASRMSSVPGLNARPEAALLPLVDGDHGVEDLQLVADLSAGADGGAQVLGKAAAPEPRTGEQELG